MELINFEGLTLGSIIAGLITTALLLAIGWVTNFVLRHQVAAKIAFYFTNRFSGRLICYLIAALATWQLFARYSPSLLGTGINAPFVGALTFALLLLYSQFKFALLGLHSAQLTVHFGTNYSRSLALPRDNFRFLGTGAYKLTSDPNFVEAIKRPTQSDKPIRLLLSQPSNKFIAEAEKSASVAPGTYKHNLLESLKTLKRLKEDANANFEVRFYRAEVKNDFQNFRMMFIDDEVLLLSYNVYGRGDGRYTGQLVLKRSNLKSKTQSFYVAFEKYFERLWETSERWDYKEYV